MHACVSACGKSYSSSNSLQQHQRHCTHFLADFKAAAVRRSLKRASAPSGITEKSTAPKKRKVIDHALGVTGNDHSSSQSMAGPSNTEYDSDSAEQSSSIPPQNQSPIPPPPSLPSTPLLPSSPSSPVLNRAGRPMRRAARPASANDTLPQGPPAVLDKQVASNEMEHRSTRIRRVILIVRDTLQTQLSPFRLFRLYKDRPSYDPDAFVSLDDLKKTPTTPLASNSTHSSSQQDPPWPYPNMAIYRLMRYFNTGSSAKSEVEADRLVHEVLHAEDFAVEDLPPDFSAHRENLRADKAIASDSMSDYLTGFKTASVDIRVPSGQKDIPPATFSIPNVRYRPLLSVIQEAFSGHLSEKMHLFPYKLFHQPPNAVGEETRVHGELYTSDSFISAHEQIQKAPLPPDNPHCKLERVVAGIMLWSDATHLANFGTAKLWPIYMMLGNVSKYIRARPESGACRHLAYIPSLPDSFQDFAKSFHAKWKSQKKSILTHCRRELMHAVWKFLLDDDFIHAYKYGVVIKCADGIERRVYPRFFTYSADYPEKVLLATIRDKGLCPCPRCMVHKDALDKMGQVRDMTTRLRDYRTYLVNKVNQARRYIYNDGRPINGTHIETLLKESSSVPTENAFMERLGIVEFDLSKLLVVDFLHEFELGVWKQLFTHLIRILYAQPDGSGPDKVEILDSRFRSIPTFGDSTIRRFANNASEMKKLAARDFEDLLQCAVPAFEGLLPGEHNSRLMKLLYRLGEWHALAKLRMHTDHTLQDLSTLTTEVGTLMREFRDKTCSQFHTVELPREQEARSRRQAQVETQRSGGASRSNLQDGARKPRTLNLFTYKFHAMADYVAAIRWFGTVDSYSTQLGELAHRLVKRLYGLTNKRDPEQAIAKRYNRRNLLSRAKVAKSRADLKRKRTSAVKSHSEGQSVHAHQVGFGHDEKLQDISAPLDLHYHISRRRDHPIDLTPFLEENSSDPAKKNFLPKLEDHLLGRLREIPFDGDYEFTNEDRRDIVIVNEKIFAVQTLRINYTTYDVRRAQDVINPRTDHCTVMLNSPETQPNSHRYWYAQVLGIFHADVIHFDSQIGVVKSRKVMDFLWVRWLGVEPGYRSGSRYSKLPKVGFVPESDEFAFGFLDPDQVIRACHLIPDFESGRTNDLLSTADTTAARKVGENDDWLNFYVMIFVDRDMFMRFHGGGIGHIDILRDEDDGSLQIPPNDSDNLETHDLERASHVEPNSNDDRDEEESEEFAIDSDEDSEAGEDNWLLDYVAPMLDNNGCSSDDDGDGNEQENDDDDDNEDMLL